MTGIVGVGKKSFQDSPIYIVDSTRRSCPVQNTICLPPVEYQRPVVHCPRATDETRRGDQTGTGSVPGPPNHHEVGLILCRITDIYRFRKFVINFYCQTVNS